MFLRLLALLSFSAALSFTLLATSDGGGFMDPNGGTALDGGGAMDPNGASSDSGPGMDPNGYTGCVDPNG